MFALVLDKGQSLFRLNVESIFAWHTNHVKQLSFECLLNEKKNSSRIIYRIISGFLMPCDASVLRIN